MKLLFSISYYTPYVSGLTLYVRRLAGEFAKKNHKVTILTNQHTPVLANTEEIERVKVLRAKPLMKISKGFLSVDFLLKSFIEAGKNEVIFINLPQFEGFLPALFGKISGKKVIAIYHCEVKLPSGVINFLIENVLELSNWLTMLLSEKIITYSEDFARHSADLQMFKGKISAVYPPIYKPKINKRVQKMIREKAGKNGLRIGVAARLSAEKGLEYLFKAIPKLPNNCRIIIAGSMDPVGEEQYKEKILRILEKYRKQVIFLGELKEEEMGSFYSLLDVLVLPSINSTESFGMVQVEAMMMGIPVVATNLPGVRVPIQKTGMGKLVAPKDSGSLANAIVEIIRNRQKFVKKTESVMKEFSPAKTVSFYDKILKSYKQ